MAPEDGHPDLTLRDYLEVLRRAKWIMLLVVVVVPTAAVLLALRQPPRYEASAQVLISRQNLATQLNNLGDPTTLDPARTVKTYAQLARVPEVARRALEAAGVRDRAPSDLLGASSVEAMAESDLLVFRVSDADPGFATRLATEYAEAFVSYRGELEVGALASARQSVQARIDQLEARGDRDSALYQTLVEKEEQLVTMEALQAGRAVVVRIPSGAAQVQPRPERSGAIGLVFGVMLALGLAFLYNALDSRVRSERNLLDRLGLPVLGRIPKPPRRIRRRRQLAMLATPFAHHAEAFRMLRSSVEFANSKTMARVIMVTSARAGEGKSTTVGNLAVAFAGAGRDTVLVDLDLRASFLEEALGVGGAAGLTNVVAGEVALDDALRDVPFGPRFDVNGDGPSPRGRFRVLPLGARPTNPADFAALRAIPAILEELSRRADIVLVDSPALLVASDALALTAYVDAVVVVARLNLVRSQELDELRRALDACPAEKLGVVATGTEDGTSYYGDRYLVSPASSRARREWEHRGEATTAAPRSP